MFDHPDTPLLGVKVCHITELSSTERPMLKSLHDYIVGAKPPKTASCLLTPAVRGEDYEAQQG